MPFTLIINAGGQSQRMGQPKALLPMPPQQTPLLRHLWQRLQAIAERTILIANEPTLAEQAGITAAVAQYADRYADAGPLGGMATGLALCDDWAILVACDMPFADPDLFGYLKLLTGEKRTDEKRDDAQEPLDAPKDAPWDAIVPVVNGFAEPLHALYHRRSLPHIEQRLARGERRATSFYADIHVRYVQEAELRRTDPQLRSFINVNTPEDWQTILQNAAER